MIIIQFQYSIHPSRYGWRRKRKGNISIQVTYLFHLYIGFSREANIYGDPYSSYYSTSSSISKHQFSGFHFFHQKVFDTGAGPYFQGKEASRVSRPFRIQFYNSNETICSIQMILPSLIYVN